MRIDRSDELREWYADVPPPDEPPVPVPDRFPEPGADRLPDRRLVITTGHRSGSNRWCGGTTA
jgi:hypothetical protein